MSSELSDNKGIKLILAVLYHDMTSIRSLLPYVDINFQNNDGCTPLYMAVNGNHLDTIKYLLEQGANPNITANTRDVFGKTHKYFSPIMVASQTGHVEALQLLLKHRADVNLLDDNRNTALHMAVNLDITKKLLEYGADPNIQNFSNATSLHKASSCLNNEAIKLLIKNGACPNTKNSNGNTPLHLTIIKNWSKFDGCSDTVDILLQLGADINAFNHDGNLALHLVTDRNMDDVNIMDCLIDYLMIR